MTNTPDSSPPQAVTPRARVRWLVPAGALAAIFVAVFAAAGDIDARAATVGIVLTVVWLAAMVVTAFTVRVPRVHSRLQFGLMLAMVALAFAVLYAIFLGAGG